MLEKILIENGFTHKEAKIYLSGLELGSAPASSIARHCKENRVTVYTILKDLSKRGIAIEVIKNNIKSYTMLDPKKLIKMMQKKVKNLEKSLPVFLGKMNQYQEKTKTYFYDGMEDLKKLYKDLVEEASEIHPDNPICVFVGTQNIDLQMQKFLIEEFAPWRLQYPVKTKAIYTKKSQYRYQDKSSTKHENIFIQDDDFQMSNEIILYGGSKVAMMMFENNELYAVVVESKSLHDGFKNLFNLLRKYHHKIEQLEQRLF